MQIVLEKQIWIASKLRGKEITAQIANNITCIWVQHARENLTVNKVLGKGRVHGVGRIDSKSHLVIVTHDLIHLVVNCTLQLGEDLVTLLFCCRRFCWAG